MRKSGTFSYLNEKKCDSIFSSLSSRRRGKMRQHFFESKPSAARKMRQHFFESTYPAARKNAPQKYQTGR